MSMKEHYKRLLGEMAQTRARGEQMARDISDAQKHSDKTKAIRDKHLQDLQDIGADPDYDPNTHLDAAAEKGLDLVAATDAHRDAFLNLVRLQRRNEMEQASKTLYDVDGQRVVTPRARRPEAAARSQRAARRSRGNVREDVQTDERATQTTRNIRRLGREATALGKRSDAIYQGIYGIHPRDARDISSLYKIDFSKVMADPFGHDYGDSVDAYIDARIAQGRASKRARREREHPTNIYGRGGKVVGTLASPGKPATGVGRGKTAKDFVGKKTAKKTSTTKPKPKASTKKPVKSFKKRLKEALLGESGGPEQHQRIEDAIFQKGYGSDVDVDHLIAASARLRGNIRGRKARRLGPQPFSYGAHMDDGTPASLQRFKTSMPLAHGDWREAGGVSADEIVAAARAGAHPNLTPDLAAEIMQRRLAGLGKAGGGVDNPTFFKDLRSRGLLGPTIRQARIEAQRRAHQLGEMAQTAARRRQTGDAAETLQGFSTHSALPTEVQAEYAAKLARLQRVIGQEQSSPKTYDLGGRIVGPGGRLGRRRANDPAQFGGISIASDSGRRAAAARMPFGM